MPPPTHWESKKTLAATCSTTGCNRRSQAVTLAICLPPLRSVREVSTIERNFFQSPSHCLMDQLKRNGHYCRVSAEQQRYSKLECPTMEMQVTALTKKLLTGFARSARSGFLSSKFCLTTTKDDAPSFLKCATRISSSKTSFRSKYSN